MNDFSVTYLISVVRKSIVYIIASALVCAAAAYCYCTFATTPTYAAKASFLATNNGFGTETEDASAIKSTDIAASIALVNTYVGILQTNGVYEELAAKSNLGYSAKQLKSMISVNVRSEDSLFIDVQVVSKKPEDSVKIANAFLSVGTDYVNKVMPNSFIREIEQSTGAKKNYPNTPATAFLFAVCGAVVVFCLAVFVSMMDKTIKGESDFKAHYDIPVLGNIPNFKNAARGESKA